MVKTMNIQNIDKKSYDINKYCVRKSDNNSNFIKAESNVFQLFAFEKDTIFSTAIKDKNGSGYSFVGSYAEDYTRENPRIKIEYIPFDNNKEPIEKYIDPRQVDFRNATVGEYYAAVYYLNDNERNISCLTKPGTTGLDYNNQDRYDFVSLLERDIKMYKANGVQHHVLHYQKILNNINNVMSTDYYKNNVNTNERGIGVEEALRISRKKHGISQPNNIENLFLEIKSQNSEMLLNIGESSKDTSLKTIIEKNRLEEDLKKLWYDRKLTQEAIEKVQILRKENIERLQKENLIKLNPYDLG